MIDISEVLQLLDDTKLFIESLRKLKMKVLNLSR